MRFLKAKKRELAPIMRIIEEAQGFLASHHIDQWQNGYPNEAAMHRDILNNESFVVASNDSTLIGTAMFSTRKESTYMTIEGSWITKANATYGVIHRMAVTNEFRNKGVAKFIFEQCEQLLLKNHIDSMRIDTHQDNLAMQGLLKQLKYTYCGVIYLDDGDKRLAYEKRMTG